MLVLVLVLVLELVLELELVNSPVCSRAQVSARSDLRLPLRCHRLPHRRKRPALAPRVRRLRRWSSAGVCASCPLFKFPSSV